MDSYRMKETDLPLDDSWDVIVVGGGPSGCAAAIAAAREGVRTLLIEATCALGGMGTSGLVPEWAPISDKEKIIYRGIAGKVIGLCKDGMPHVNAERVDWIPIDAELLKRIYDDLVTSAGVRVLFQTTLAAVETIEEGVVTNLILANKSGLSAYSAKLFIDCTGDADLAAFAGAPYEKGDENGEMQPATLCFVLSNVDTNAYNNGFNLKRSDLKPMLDSGKYPLLQGSHACNFMIGPGTVGFNVGHIWDVDNTDPSSTTEAMFQGRRIAAQFRDALSEFLPEAFGNAFLVATGSLPGARESRRIVGDYILTIEDFLARRSFPDEVCRNSYPIDVHVSKDEIEAANRGKIRGLDRFKHYGKGESHGIPYRCLTPKGLHNVLVAGRSISTDRMVQGSLRVMPVCLCVGEATGVAAAMSASTNGNVHTVNTDELRARLKKHGAYLPDPEE